MVLMVRHRMKEFRERLVSFWIYITSNFDSGTEVIGLRTPDAASFFLLPFAHPGLSVQWGSRDGTIQGNHVCFLPVRLAPSESPASLSHLWKVEPCILLAVCKVH